MNRVDTTASSTPAWTRRGPDPAAPVSPRPPWHRRWASLWRALLCALALLMAWPAIASSEPEVLQAAVQRSADGARLSVRLRLHATPAVEAALLKGVPLYFVWQADVVRERWYWTDKRMGSAARTIRLAYQPLTRRWRVSVSADGAASAAGLQYALHQNFESLDEALAAVSRVAGWTLVEPGRLEEGVSYQAQWRFRLDLSLLPRPFQIGMVNQPDWLIEVQRSLEVPARNEVEGPEAGQGNDGR